jgi:progressive ankylosis protein
MRVREIFRLWLPLAISFELMMLEGPAVQGAMGRLPEPQLHLAAWGLTMGLSLLIESPVIMLLSTAIALVGDTQAYRALRRFVLILITGCTVITGLLIWTPLFDFAAGRLMGQPPEIVAAARPAMQLMLLWTAAIGWRRFYQGILVRYGKTHVVTLGTVLRLAATVIPAVVLARSGALPGVQVGAVALMSAVITEAIATTFFAASTVRRLPPPAPDAVPLTQRAIFRFHLPLALTTLLTLLAQPITAAALAKLPQPAETLAAWPVAAMILLVIRGFGLAIQEISIAQSANPESRPALRKFTLCVGIITSAFTVLFVATPLSDVYADRVIALPSHLKASVRLGVGMAFLLPLLTALSAWVRGILVAQRRTQTVYVGMGINLLTHGGLLILGVLAQTSGMILAALSITTAAAVEYAYLFRMAGAGRRQERNEV